MMSPDNLLSINLIILRIFVTLDLYYQLLINLTIRIAVALLGLLWAVGPFRVDLLPTIGVQFSFEQVRACISRY